MEQIPKAFKVIFHLTASADDKTLLGILNTVTGAAGQLQLFQYVNVFPFHLSVTDEEAGRREAGQAASYQICGFLIHAFGFSGACKRFIISITVIHILTSLDLLFSVCRNLVAIG